MIRLNFAEDDIEKLKKRALESPREMINSIEKQFKRSLEEQYHSKAHFLLSLSYKSISNIEKELDSINSAVDSALNLEDKIKALVRRGAYYNDYSFHVKAFINYTTAENLYESNKLDNIDLLLSIKISMLYLFRNYPQFFPYNSLFNKIDAQIHLCKNKYILAHYYKSIGLYFFRLKKYDQTIEQFELAAIYFKEMGFDKEVMQLNSLFSICKFKLNNPEYISHKIVYEKHLRTVENKMIPSHYILAVIRAELNPLTFCDFTVDWYLDLLDYFKLLKEYKQASIIYTFIAQKYESENNFNLAICYLKKQSEYNLKAMQIEEENKLFELSIQQEIHQQLENSQSEIFADAQSSSSFIKNYVSENLVPFVAQEMNSGNYKIMSNLLIDQFKTQVSICTNYGIKFLETNNIQVLESDGNYTILYDKDAKRHISSKPLAYYEKQLDPKSFLRTHRSYIININFIKHFFPGRVGKIELTNGQIIEVSARKMAEVRKRILY